MSVLSIEQGGDDAIVQQAGAADWMGANHRAVPAGVQPGLPGGWFLPDFKCRQAGPRASSGARPVAAFMLHGALAFHSQSSKRQQRPHSGFLALQT